MVLANAEVGGAYSAADTMSYDDVVDPRDLRDRLLAALLLTAARRAQPVGPVDHHGIAP
jgi:acetyl-CoA carboxylase carboxyltransferase component